MRLEEAFDSVAKGFVDDLINEALFEKITLEEQMPKVRKDSKIKKTKIIKIIVTNVWS